MKIVQNLKYVEIQNFDCQSGLLQILKTFNNNLKLFKVHKQKVEEYNVSKAIFLRKVVKTINILK